MEARWEIQGSHRHGNYQGILIASSKILNPSKNHVLFYSLYISFCSEVVLKFFLWEFVMSLKLYLNILILEVRSWKFIGQKVWEPWKSQFLILYLQNRNSVCAKMGHSKHFHKILLSATTEINYWFCFNALPCIFLSFCTQMPSKVLQTQCHSIPSVYTNTVHKDV